MDSASLKLDDGFDRSSHWFSRISASVLLIALAVWAAALLVVLITGAEPEALVGQWRTGTLLLGFVQDLQPYQRTLVGVGAAVMGLFSVSLVFNLLSAGPEVTRHVLVADEEGFVLVDSQGIEAVAAGAAMRAPGVVDVDIRATGVGSAPIRLDALVGVHPGAPVAEAGSAVQKHAREAVERLVGIPVRSVVVDVRVLAADELARGFPA